ncbi:MAG: iron donor protein CyaY [Formosimonas sp.]
MTETEFLSHVKQLFDQLALRIEADFPDFDVNQHGAILEIENDDGAKIIINQQTAMQEVWLASREGGYHFKWAEGVWINTRDGGVFDEYLSKALSLLED